MDQPDIRWEDVEEGQELPGFTYELSLLRLVAFVRASGLYDYVHFDGAYARAAGARDAFVSTPHVAGLFGRLLTGWSGPEGEIRSLAFSMRTQSCANDRIARKSPSRGRPPGSSFRCGLATPRAASCGCGTVVRRKQRSLATGISSPRNGCSTISATSCCVRRRSRCSIIIRTAVDLVFMGQRPVVSDVP